jgi:glycine C-acetyltransferase
MVFVETLLASLERVRNDHWRREKMWRISKLLKKGLRNLGYDVGEVPSPLTPVYVPAGDEQVAQQLIAGLRDLGVFVTGVMYPVVPHGMILFRLVPTASHTEEDVERTLGAFEHVRDHLRLKLNAA